MKQKILAITQKVRSLAFERFFEIFIILNYWIWLIVFSSDDSFLGIPIHSHFQWPRYVYIGMFLFLGIASLLCFRETSRSRFFAGFVMLIGALIWFKLSLNFWRLYPPLNTSMFVYSVMALFTALLGVFTIEKSRNLRRGDGRK